MKLLWTNECSEIIFVDRENNWKEIFFFLTTCVFILTNEYIRFVQLWKEVWINVFFSLSLFSCNYVLILYVYEDYIL